MKTVYAERNPRLRQIQTTRKPWIPPVRERRHPVGPPWSGGYPGGWNDALDQLAGAMVPTEVVRTAFCTPVRHIYSICLQVRKQDSICFPILFRLRSKESVFVQLRQR